MRRSLKIPGFAHKNPVPTGCRKGPLVMTGGISGLDPETGELPASVEDQCRNIFIHFQAVMAAAGGSVEDIIKVTVWLADPAADREVLNKEWLALFPDPDTRPTRHVFPHRGNDPYRIVCDLTAWIGD